MNSAQKNIIGSLQHLQPQSLFDVVFHYEFESVNPNGNEGTYQRCYGSSTYNIVVKIICTISFVQRAASSKLNKFSSTVSPKMSQTPTRTRSTVILKKNEVLRTLSTGTPSTLTSFPSRIIATLASINAEKQKEKTLSPQTPSTSIDKGQPRLMDEIGRNLHMLPY